MSIIVSVYDVLMFKDHRLFFFFYFKLMLILNFYIIHCFTVYFSILYSLHVRMQANRNVVMSLPTSCYLYVVNIDIQISNQCLDG